MDMYYGKYSVRATGISPLNRDHSDLAQASSVLKMYLDGDQVILTSDSEVGYS